MQKLNNKELASVSSGVQGWASYTLIGITALLSLGLSGLYVKSRLNKKNKVEILSTENTDLIAPIEEIKSEEIETETV